MDALQLPIRLLATVTRTAKFRTPDNRAYEAVGFMVQLDTAAYYRGEPSLDEDYRSARKMWAYVDGTKQVADVIKALEGLKLGERVYLRVVEISAFGGGGTDAEGRRKDPMVKLVVDHIELPGRAFKNQPLKKMADKAAAKAEPQDATAAAEAKTLAGTTK